MKKYKYILFLLFISNLLCIDIVYAHPGRTDSRGCHTCRTNCSKWGLSYGEYHCHNGSSSSSSSSSQSTPSYTYGCTDPNAKNYNSKANKDNGTCKYYKYGCTDKNSINYDSTAEKDDGTCVAKVYGCMDVKANNYNPDANVSNHSCTYDVKGCTDKRASNYDEYANINDGSCMYKSKTNSVDEDKSKVDLSSAANSVNDSDKSTIISTVVGLGVIGGIAFVIDYMRRK